MVRATAIIVLALLAAVPCPGQDKTADYLTAGGQLKQPLHIRDVQGGFAGFTGTAWRIEADGQWSVARVFNKKEEVQGQGKLTPAQLVGLAKELAKYDLANLKTEGKASVNPHVVTITWGRQEFVLTLMAGQALPGAGTDSLPGRYSGVASAVREMLKKKE